MKPATGTRVRFGPYEADVAAGELRKNGGLVRLQEQPFQILITLLSRAGEVVTREELRERLWPNDSFGDFDQGLNTAINKLREALADSAAHPQFIETLPKRGYRFTHPVEAEPMQSVVQDTLAKRLPLGKPYSLFAIVPILIAVGIFALRWAGAPTRDQPLSLRRFTIKHPVPGSSVNYRLLAVSPDGNHIVITADRGDRRLWIRDLDQEQPRPLEGTEGAWVPFWSPDSKSIGFGVYGKMQKISAKGGSPIVLCDVGDCRISGGSWSPDGASIVFTTASDTLLYQVPASGGTARLLLSPKMLDGSQAPGRLGQPYFLPGEGRSEAVIFVYKDSLMVLETATGRYHVLGRGTNPSYSPNGHLLYRFGNDLWSRPFSLQQLRFAGEAFRIARDATDPSVSSDGTLVYRDAVAEQLVGSIGKAPGSERSASRQRGILPRSIPERTLCGRRDYGE